MCTITISNPSAPSDLMLRGRKGQKGHDLSEFLHLCACHGFNYLYLINIFFSTHSLPLVAFTI